MAMVDIQSLFADIIESPRQRQQAMAEMGQREAQIATNALSGRSQIFAPLVGALARNQGARDEMLQRSVGGLFGLDTRNESEKLQQMLSSAQTPEQQAQLPNTLRQMGYGQQAMALEQQLAEQARALEDRERGVLESQANIAQMNANTERLNAERLKTIAETSPEAARTAIQTEVVDNVILTVDENGKTVVKDVSGTVYEGEEATEALSAARQRQVEQRRAMNQAAESGTITARMSKEAFDQASSMSSALSQYSEAINAIDDGALSGRLQRFLPTFREQTLRLQQIQTEMGLGVVSATTFGSLSEGELNLAMSVNAPDLPPAQLRQWYIAKTEATKKLQEALYKQAIYFSNPNATVGGWIELQQGERERREALEDSSSSPENVSVGSNDDRSSRVAGIIQRANASLPPNPRNASGANVRGGR